MQTKLKIATWNVNSINVRFDILENWLINNSIDIALLQETKCEAYKFPSKELEALNYRVLIDGQKSYNGVAILTKFPIISQSETQYATSFHRNPSATEARYLETLVQTPIGPVRVICVYVPNGGAINHERYNIKLEFLAALRMHLAQLAQSGEKIILGGDLNVAPFDIDVHNPKALQGCLGFSMPEKKLLREIYNIGYNDCYRCLYPDTQQFSWWDYRKPLQENVGWRIDGILANSLMLDFLNDCYVDYGTRQQQRPSDHAPVVASFA